MSVEDILNELYKEGDKLLNPPEPEDFTEEDWELFARNYLTEEFWEGQQRLIEDYKKKGYLT